MTLFSRHAISPSGNQRAVRPLPLRPSPSPSSSASDTMISIGTNLAGGGLQTGSVTTETELLQDHRNPTSDTTPTNHRNNVDFPSSNVHVSAIGTGDQNLQEDSFSADEITLGDEQVARVKRWQAWRDSLAVIITLWALYTTIRYFVAFSLFRNDRIRQLYALTLGILSSSTFTTYIGNAMYHYFNYIPKGLSTFFIISLYFSTTTLAAPAIVNVILCVIWNGIDSEHAVQGRCAWEMDILWTGTSQACSGTQNEVSWVAWLVGSVIRLTVTLVITGLFHYTRHVCSRLELPSLSRSSSTIRFPFSPGDPDIRPRVLRRHRGQIMRQQQPETRPSIIPGDRYPDPEMSSDSASSQGTSPDSQQQQAHLAPSGSTNTNNEFFLPPPPPLFPLGDRLGPTDTMLQNWASDFQSLVEHVNRETGEGAHLPGVIRRPDTVMVVGGAVRRMETIESLGSREVQSNPSSSRSHTSSSRPHTSVVRSDSRGSRMNRTGVSGDNP